MPHIHSLPPIESPQSRVLILGTMPGAESLRKQRYYAHPRNLFWPILAEILGFDANSAYEARTASLVMAGIAVWDVLQTCTREGSLDSDIDESTVLPNDFAWFFANHPHIQRIYFNGVKAEELYRKYVQPRLSVPMGVEYTRLPSTSPANAAMARGDKAMAWRAFVA